jgi:hypothetical protein
VNGLRQRIVHILTSHRLPLSDEKQLQIEIAVAFASAGLAAEREVRLAPGDIVDFMVGDIAVEVKIKGSKRDIFRQVERYCEHNAVRELVLATNVPMALPPMVCGKPTSVALLGLGWL